MFSRPEFLASLEHETRLRKQFFCAKQAGNASLDTGDCWAGVHYGD